MLGKIERFVTNISDILSTKLIPTDTQKLEKTTLHRLLRDVFFVALVLVLVAVIQSYLGNVDFLPFLPFVISGIGLGVAILLITDAVFVFQKLSHGHIMASLLKEDEDSLPK